VQRKLAPKIALKHLHQLFQFVIVMLLQSKLVALKELTLQLLAERMQRMDVWEDVQHLNHQHHNQHNLNQLNLNQLNHNQFNHNQLNHNQLNHNHQFTEHQHQHQFTGHQHQSTFAQTKFVMME
jgi:hypothetical protein